jgi:hypothetical protein
LPIYPNPPTTTFTTVTVTETFTDDDGNPASGEVILSLTGSMHNTSTGYTSGQIYRKVYLDDTGSISVPLFATDDITTTPVGRKYHVTVRLVGAPSYSGYILVPSAAPGATATLDMLWDPPLV